MEKLENKTHSAFLSELLTPDGSHLKGNVFLQLFIEILREQKITMPFDALSACVKTEHYIGERNNEKKSGGRIDIYIVR